MAYKATTPFAKIQFASFYLPKRRPPLRYEQDLSDNSNGTKKYRRCEFAGEIIGTKQDVSHRPVDLDCLDSGVHFRFREEQRFGNWDLGNDIFGKSRN